MINQITLVGRLVRTPELDLTESGKKVSTITLAVPREYKNVNGEYDADFIDCTLWTGVAESASEYCKTGDVIGVRGKVQSRLIEKEDGTKVKKMEVVADRISFLASSRSNENKKDSKNDDCEDDFTDSVININNNDVLGENNDTLKSDKSSKKKK